MEPDGGSAMIPVALFMEIYEYALIKFNNLININKTTKKLLKLFSWSTL